MSTYTTVPTVKAYLFTLCQNAIQQVPGHSLTVCLDDPGRNQSDDIFIVGQVTNRTAKPWQMIGTGGPGWMIEEYDIALIANVFRGGPDQLEPWERAWDMNAAVERAIRVDPSLGGAVILTDAFRSSDRSDWQEQHKGRLVQVETKVHVKAEI